VPRPNPDAAPPSRVRARVKRWVRPLPTPSADGPFTELDARRLGAVRRYFVRHPVVMDVVVALWYAIPATVTALFVAAGGASQTAGPQPVLGMAQLAAA
jgi:hypothetical protein